MNTLLNTQEEYNRYHLLPGWYQDFAGNRAKTAWITEADAAVVLTLLG